MRHAAVFVLLTVTALLTSVSILQAAPRDVIRELSGYGDRRPGTPGDEKAVAYLQKAFREAGVEEVGTQVFLLPTGRLESASLEADGKEYPVYPWGPNMVYLPVTPKEGISSEIVYVGEGLIENFNEQDVKDKIVLMDLDSVNRWMHAYMFEAEAVVYIGNKESVQGNFQCKETPAPLAFQRYWVSPEVGEELKNLAENSNSQVTIHSRASWKHSLLTNVYAIVPGKHPDKSRKLVVLEAHYGASSYILGKAPGADEATSIAVMLETARYLAENPPDYSVMFLATAGDNHDPAGMRHFVGTMTTRTRLMREQSRYLRERKNQLDQQIELMKLDDPLAVEDPEKRKLVWEIVVEKAKDMADRLIRERQYQVALKLRSEALGADLTELDTVPAEPPEIQDPKPYRRISFRAGPEQLQPEERRLAVQLLRDSIPDLRAEQEELGIRKRINRSKMELKGKVYQYRPELYLSLNLSTHARHCGIVEWGDTFWLNANVKKLVRAYRLKQMIGEISQDIVEETGLPSIMFEAGEAALAGGGKAPATFNLASDFAAAAAFPAVSLATLDDDRSLWATPHDTMEQMNLEQLDRLSNFIPRLIFRLCKRDELSDAMQRGVVGTAVLEGQANFIRQGELFADQPAPGTIVNVMNGGNIFRTMVFMDGSFTVPGLANRRVSMQKFILEPYQVDPVTGRVIAAVDKQETGKNNYRVKVKSKEGNAALVMFHCDQTDIMGLFHPKKLTYLTKPRLIDATTEAKPRRYWYSRIDGRDTMAFSVFLERGTWFKLILAQSWIRVELLLLNSDEKQPLGRGFLIGDPPVIAMAPYQGAQDMHLLLDKRLTNLKTKGIRNRYLEDLYDQAEEEMDSAAENLDNKAYNLFWEDVTSAWGKFYVIYDEIGNIQRDVLGGVMFFIALFVPFAFCMERYLFCFRTIYQQIVAFIVILLATIFTIRALHPAFQLTYNPMVVILAFFIVGLSVMVAWIIFVRFEHEMDELKGEVSEGTVHQVSKWQAFGAGFSIGVSNLNRRKLRTALTCTTLVILTFTIMSFTNVKSVRKTTDTLISDSAPYRGVLLRHMIWNGLTPLTLTDMHARYGRAASIWPRGWVEPFEEAGRVLVRVYGPEGSVPVEGVLGVGHNPPEPFRNVVKEGRWFDEGERRAIMLPVTMARELGLDPERDLGTEVNLWGYSFRVTAFLSEERLEKTRDLDGNPITPAYLQMGLVQRLSAVEMEAMESGEERLPLTEQFRHSRADATIVIPYSTCRAHGGDLKAISILPKEGRSPLDLAGHISSWLLFPLFVGEDGTWFHSAGKALRYSGAANLMIPILIAVFICMNTMIGHVHERKKEIGIYTSVGLAPSHVGFLFIVEALSLAVLSTVIGYILAQLSAKYLGETALFSELTFNYSSLASVACMVLVFSVVLLASLYPAHMAAEIAMPDVNRSWTLPESVNEMITMQLPFLLKYEEEGPLMGFLTEFFRSYEDVAHGDFIVDGTTLDADIPFARELSSTDVCLMMRADVWLAPFDFGLKQRVQIHCCPSADNPGYLELAIRMIRVSGEHSAWVRANKNFIKALRKQMLLWRTLDRATKLRFQQTTPDGYSGYSEGSPA